VNQQGEIMHYRNGREAKVGDTVVGLTYNRKGQVAGTLLSLTPGPDNCSAKVGYLETFPVSAIQRHSTSAPGFIGPDDKVVKVVIIQGAEQHGAYGFDAVTVYREDYTDAGNLWHADDAHWVNEAGGAVQLPKSE
jgi:hypothetical protein